MIIADVHAHLDFEQFEKDLNNVLERAEKAGVKTIICNGIDPKTNRNALSLAEKHKLIKAALGYYPCDCEKVSEEEFDKEIDFIRKNKSKIAAVGEVGLDKKHNHDFERQQACFRKLIKLSMEMEKPLIVHSRMAEEKAIEILEEMNAKKVVMHCFSGSRKLVERCIKNGWMFSIPCNVVRSQQFQEMAEIIPLQQILTETDAPFLTYDASVKRSEPAHIVQSIKKIAEIKGLDSEELSKLIFQNFLRVF